MEKQMYCYLNFEIAGDTSEILHIRGEVQMQPTCQASGSMTGVILMSHTYLLYTNALPILRIRKYDPAFPR